MKNNRKGTTWIKALNKGKVTFLKGWRQTFFVKFFLNSGVLGKHKRGCAEFAPFWMKKKIYICTPWKSAKRAKSHIFKGSKNGIKIFFFLLEGSLRPIRGAVQRLLHFG
jgi:hypothetical protein